MPVKRVGPGACDIFRCAPKEFPTTSRSRVECSSPVVAIVGAPNVGKSTLFNRLIGRRQSIRADIPGVMRDCLAASCEMAGTGPVTLVDTGGLVKGPVDDLTRKVSAEAMKAVEISRR